MHKKILGSILLTITAVFINMGSASVAMIGEEDMPESMKKLR